MVLEKQPSPPAAEESIPPGAEKMRVHRELKLPQTILPEGDYVFRDRASLSALLIRAAGERQALLSEKWNSIDFTRQMALLIQEEHSSGGYRVEILSIWKCATEIIVEIKDLYPDQGVVTTAFTYPRAFAVVNRSELPVRFLRRDRPWSKEGGKRQPPAAHSADPRPEIRARVDGIIARATAAIGCDEERMALLFENEIDSLLEVCLNTYDRPPLEEIRQILASIAPPTPPCA